MYTTVIASLVGEPMLAEAVASIASQSLPSERVLVVCDAGPPLPAGWTDAIRLIHPAVEFHRNDEHGMVPAINLGIELTTTQYVAFLDADDLWQPRKQERQLALLAQRPEVDAATCMAMNFRIDDGGRRAFQVAAPANMFTCTTFRRDVFRRFGGLDPACTHFTWLYRWWGDARQRGIRTESVDYVGLHRRLHEANSWSIHRETAHRDLLGELRHRVHSARSVS